MAPESAEKLFRIMDNEGVSRGLTIPFFLEALTGKEIDLWAARIGHTPGFVMDVFRGLDNSQSVLDAVRSALRFDPWAFPQVEA